MKEQICRYNKFGYCKYGDKCHFRHINEKCVTKDCKIHDCEKRHPKICIFKRKFGQCKFTTYCRYEHDKASDTFENSDKIVELENKIENLQQNSKATDTQNLNEIKKETSDKFAAIEQKFQSIKDKLEEKESLFQTLENKFKSMEEVFEKRINDLEKALKQEQKKNETLLVEFQTLEIEREIIKCEQCDFTTTSSKGFKTHTKRMHTVKNDKVELQCEVCEYVTSSKLILKRHMKTHSYTFEGTMCKCIECDFTGNNAWSIQIHNGKAHTKSIECGLCDLQTQDLETLNLHLKTCEIYECNECECVAKQISGIKKHIKNNNGCRDASIHHVKMDRDNSEETAAKEYQQCDLF